MIRRLDNISGKGTHEVLNTGGCGLTSARAFGPQEVVKGASIGNALLSTDNSDLHSCCVCQHSPVRRTLPGCDRLTVAPGCRRRLARLAYCGFSSSACWAASWCHWGLGFLLSLFRRPKIADSSSGGLPGVRFSFAIGILVGPLVQFFWFASPSGGRLALAYALNLVAYLVSLASGYFALRIRRRTGTAQLAAGV